ncbi:MAG: glycosyltransferase family 4 protein [Bacteroidaceae bacterium]|nr:glycosyltransferase family 4 protein [Bacteroidaceae bacterium]
MKVYILTGEPFPNGMAATNRIKCYARAIKEGGIDCEVVIFRRTERYGVKPKNIDGQGKTEGGIPYRFIGGTPLRGSNVFKRQIDDQLDIFRTKQYLQHNLRKGDVLFFFMGYYIELMLNLMKIAHDVGAFCVRDFCELPFGTGAETKKAIRLREKTYKEQFPKIDGVISISEALLNVAKTYTSPKCKHIKVPIMVDYDHYELDKSANTTIPYIFHAGTLYEQKDGILGMIEAFGMALQQLSFPVKYILTGRIEEASHPKELKETINKYQLTNSLEFVGYLTSNQIKDYLKYASLVISNRPRSKQDYYGFSTKVGEYLASGTPLITTNWGEAVYWLKDGISAYIIEPEDKDALAQAIIRVFCHPEEAKQIGLAGQEVCRKNFNYKVWSQPLVNFMFQLGI